MEENKFPARGRMGSKIGGCDLVAEMAESGELKEVLRKVR